MSLNFGLLNGLHTSLIPSDQAPIRKYVTFYRGVYRFFTRGRLNFLKGYKGSSNLFLEGVIREREHFVEILKNTGR